ncbi:MAG: aminopeptidase [Lachnospiraceae bacterium]|nr:aminopeptidase [Lachnospiraceae bacterium]
MKELFLTGLFFVSVLTTLTVEAIKKLLGDRPHNSNLLAAIVATVLSLCTAIFYIAYKGLAVTVQIVLVTIAFAFFSWLASMVGFDKIKQLIQQFTNK